MVVNFLGNKRTSLVDAPPAVNVNEQQSRILWMSCAVLLDYPDDDFFTRLDAVEENVSVLPAEVAESLRTFVDFTRSHTLRELQTHYVDTFDQRRRCSLYLSYYATGDTRQRGAALISFKEMLAACGFEQSRDELPDHLCVVLEAAAQENESIAAQVLATHRDGIEVLRTALHARKSPYAHLIDALTATLPELDETTRERYLSLVTAGPPTEMVGQSLPFPTSEPEARS
ncbi:Nitrate reductase-like protein NarX [Corynebacterium kalinowskii]|uniref:Nitrate reductase-like protein NarX n=1 Tax=Corynebacterium kalinowskii TaxID=2675216 RepID=A0A6B8VE66_9CORY|nr:nitrate reductase molybdenum cofactor assembly chaperone [Corynebacterium kalinowskii]QGU01359.1 Nitrate reductase-like protein NarX [Corynebacterium kalinowskii]